MESITSHAFKFTVQAGDRLQEHVVAGNDLAAAAAAAQGRVPAGARIVNMLELAELLAEPEERLGAPPVVAAAVKPDVAAKVKAKPSAARRAVPAPQSTQAAPTAPALPRVGTRRDQLLTLLRQHGGPVHLDFVAKVLEIKRGHADEVARAAVKAGLVRRVGSRTGKVQLVEQRAVAPAVAAEIPTVEPPTAPPAPAAEKPRRSRPTRVERLVELLMTKTEPVHLDEIAATLGMTRKNADNAVRIGAKAGVVRRVGGRTGLVELVGAVEPAGATPAPSPPTSAEQPATAPTRVEQLVALLTERGGQVHVTEIAVALGTTRGNADNVVWTAVKAGLVRRVGSRTGLVELVGGTSVAIEPSISTGKHVADHGG